MLFKRKISNGILSIVPLNKDILNNGDVISNRNNKDIGYKDLTTLSVTKAITNDDDNIALQTAISYNKDHNLSPYINQINSSPSSLSKQAAIGKAFQLALENSDTYKNTVFNLYKKHYPNLIHIHKIKDYDDLLKKSYTALQLETINQFNSMPVKMQFHNGELDYNSSDEMMRDIHHHRNINVYKGHSYHDFLNQQNEKLGINSNEMFRAVHDFFGHGIKGNSFGAKGEEIAYESHYKTFSPLARIALASETRGQNSYVNYTNINSDNYVKMEHHRKLARECLHNNDINGFNANKKTLANITKNWNYSPQKSLILPPSMIDLNYNGGMPKSIHDIIPKNGKYDVDKDHLKLVQLAKSHNTTSYLSNQGGIYDKNNAIKDFNALLTYYGYDGVNKHPML